VSLAKNHHTTQILIFFFLETKITLAKIFELFSDIVRKKLEKNSKLKNAVLD